MIINLKRHWFTNKSTMGIMQIDGVYQCFTLEDTARPVGIKIAKETCIPVGEYPVIVDFSQRFQKQMPHVLNVPMFEGIRIHSGNTAADTEGCPIVGYQRGPDLIWESTKAYTDVFEKIKSAFDKQEPICLVVTNEQL